MPLVTATLADLYMRQGHYAEAIAVLEALLRATPGRADLERRLVEARRRSVDEATPAPRVEGPPRPGDMPRPGSVATASTARVELLEELLARVERRRRRRDPSERVA